MAIALKSVMRKKYFFNFAVFNKNNFGEHNEVFRYHQCLLGTTNSSFSTECLLTSTEKLKKSLMTF